MVIVMSTDATEADIRRVLDWLAEQNCRGELTVGVERTIITVVGPSSPSLEQDVRVLPLVESVVLLSKSYKLAGRDAKSERTEVRVGDITIGADTLTLIAGSGTVESEEQIVALARAVREAGATLLTGGAMRPDASPYAFEGLGEEGLRFLAQAGGRSGLAVVSEAPDASLVETVARYADVIEIGAYNMRNFGLLEAVAATGKPVLLRRALSATIDEWLLSAERILYAGNEAVILCESGIRTYEPATRTTTDLSAVPLLKRLSHLPVIVDPAGSSGAAALVEPLALAAVAAGADGLVVQVHANPDHAIADGPQSITPDQFARLAQRVARLGAVLGRPLHGATAPRGAGPA